MVRPFLRGTELNDPAGLTSGSPDSTHRLIPPLLITKTDLPCPRRVIGASRIVSL